MSDEPISRTRRAEDLALSFLRPRRPRLADALEVVTGIERALIDQALAHRWSVRFDKHHCSLHWVSRDARGAPLARVEMAPKDRVRDPREAWELLAGRGVIPDDWVGTNARRFARGQYASAPPTLAGVVAIASDPEGVLEVERLAREVAGRLTDWGVGRGARVVWHVDEPLTWITSGQQTERYSRTEVAIPGGDVMHELMTAVGYSVPAAQVVRRGRAGVVRRGATLGEEATRFLSLTNDARAKPLAHMLDANQAWMAARSANREVRMLVPGAVASEDVVRMVPASELPDPFEPLIMLHRRGYVLVELTRKSIQLYAACVLEGEAPVDLREAL
ncbi:MAG: hypothetical protein U0269_05500 [Polyangiales bacterium]